jgi:hypothetical protein
LLPKFEFRLIRGDRATSRGMKHRSPLEAARALRRSFLRCFFMQLPDLAMHGAAIVHRFRPDHIGDFGHHHMVVVRIGTQIKLWLRALRQMVRDQVPRAISGVFA